MDAKSDNIEFIHPGYEAPVGYSLNTHARYSLLHDLAWSLQACGALDQLRRSPFAWLEHVTDLSFTFPAKAALYILSREIRFHGQRPDEFWFHIGGHMHRFGRQEFCLLTGLRFGRIARATIVEDELPADSVLYRYFDPETIVTAVDIVALLGSTTDRMEADAELPLEERMPVADALSLAYAAIVGNWILGREDRVAIPLWVWHLVEDRVAFDSFPWGTVAYSAVLHHFPRVVRSERGAKKGQMYGLSWSLLVRCLTAIFIIISLIINLIVWVSCFSGGL